MQLPSTSGPLRRRLPLVALMSCAPMLIGCDIDYLAHLAIGQIEMLARIQPIDAAINDPSLTDVERSRLALVRDVRLFGIETIGLRETGAYTVFDPNGTEPAAYVLTAADRDRLAPYAWTFPFVGAVNYKGFFDPDRAALEALALRDAGYDVQLGRAAGFSTLGLLPDPVRQSNLGSDEIELAELILHEMAHTTIYKPSDTDFNESMATFVGRASALRFFIARHGAGSNEAVSASNRFEDKVVVDGFVARLYEDADAYYAAAHERGDDRETIIAGRQAVFASALASFETDYEPRLNNPQRWSFLRDWELNNAVILGAVRYQGVLSDFADVLDAAGGDFPAALQVFSEAAARSDSRSYLRQWAAER